MKTWMKATVSTMALAACSVIFSLASGAHAQSVPAAKTDGVTYQFPYLGIDDGWQERLEAIPGRTFESISGKQVDALKYMAAKGANAIRVTVNNQQVLKSGPYTNGPLELNGQTYNIYQQETYYLLDYGGVDHQVSIARRAKKLGMKIVLTIDFNQPIPERWITHSYKQMLNDIDEETKRLLDPFLDAGIQPDIVVASNESNGGTLSNPPAASTDTRGDRSLSNGTVYSDGSDPTKIDAVFSNLATGDASIWVKCAGFYKEAILAVKADLVARGLDPTKTKIALHSNAGGDPIAFYKRIYAPNYPDQESVYYPGDPANPGPSSGKIVTSVPKYLRDIRLADLVDIMGVSHYPGAPTTNSDAAFDTAINTERPEGGCGPLNGTLDGLSTYTQNYPNLKGLILEFAVSPGDDGLVSTQAAYITYVLKELSEPQYSRFMLGAMWWEPEYAQFDNNQRLFAPGPFYVSYGGDPNYDDSPLYQATETLRAWGKFAAPRLEPAEGSQ